MPALVQQDGTYSKSLFRFVGLTNDFNGCFIEMVVMLVLMFTMNTPS